MPLFLVLLFFFVSFGLFVPGFLVVLVKVKFVKVGIALDRLLRLHNLKVIERAANPDKEQQHHAM